MGLSKTDTWKSKIDPAFDEFIRTYITFLGLCQLPAGDGYLCPDEKALKFLERKGYPALDKQYDLDFKVTRKAVPDLIKLGVSKNIRVTARPMGKDVMRFVKYVTDMLESLPEGESKNYYMKQLIPFETEEEGRAFVEGRSIEELKEIKNRMERDILSLFTHIWFKNMDRLEPSPAKGRKKINELRLIRINLSHVYSILSQLVHKKPMKKLIEDARSGIDEALFNALQIDKTLFNAEWVRKRIIKAQYTGDHYFFEGLANSIKRTPLQNDMEYIDLYLVLSFFWKIGLYRLTNNERIELLESSGIRVQEDPETFRTYVNRLKDEGVLSD